VPLPFFAASALGTVGDIAGAVLKVAAPFLRFTPPITKDQVELLKQDNLPNPAYPVCPTSGSRPWPRRG
jgi:hypothetical protein